MRESELREVMLQALADVAPEAELAALDPADDLAEQLDIDSIDFLNVVVAVHELTGIDIPERDYPKLTTLDGAVAYLAGATPGGR
ncbi:MAG: acyl carrier protein [Arthrospira platensis]